MQDCTPLSRFALVTTVFPMQKRKKVHRLLYHSLCTNVRQDAGHDTVRRFSAWQGAGAGWVQAEL